MVDYLLNLVFRFLRKINLNFRKRIGNDGEDGGIEKKVWNVGNGKLFFPTTWVGFKDCTRT